MVVFKPATVNTETNSDCKCPRENTALAEAEGSMMSQHSQNAHVSQPCTVTSSLEDVISSKNRSAMQIQQNIFELQGLFITENGYGEERSRTRAKLKEKIEKVKDLRELEWVYGENGEVPNILID
ncbi:hypothetical protein PM082_018495 [Marasmius tenuissimus]|nr:hypothetical protein PM082_018495 [Marasmius tenuissimus]